MNTDLKILMISSDRNILAPSSAVLERVKEYGTLVAELHIVLLSNASHNLKEAQIAPNVWVYPTNSSIKYLRPLGAARIGNKLIYQKKFIRGQSIITAQDPFECGWAGLRVKRKWRLPLEVQLHTNPFSPFFTGFQNKVRQHFARTVLTNADAVRVVSQGLTSEIAAFTKAPISVLPIYVDKEVIENSPVAFDVHARYPWSFILLTVSRLSPEKNLGLAIEALALVRQTFPDTGLLVVGSGSEESRLKSLVKKLGLLGHVEFAGWQNNLTSFYKTANVFVQTSLFEGYGLSLVEAGLSELPVVTTPVGIALELEDGKDVYICPPGRPELFAQAIIDLIENNQKRENLRFNLKRALENRLLFSKENYLKELLAEWGRVAKLIS